MVFSRTIGKSHWNNNFHLFSCTCWETNQVICFVICTVMITILSFINCCVTPDTWGPTFYLSLAKEYLCRATTIISGMIQGSLELSNKNLSSHLVYTCADSFDSRFLQSILSRRSQAKVNVWSFHFSSMTRVKSILETTSHRPRCRKPDHTEEQFWLHRDLKTCAKEQRPQETQLSRVGNVKN